MPKINSLKKSMYIFYTSAYDNSRKNVYTIFINVGMNTLNNIRDSKFELQANQLIRRGVLLGKEDMYP